MCGAGFAALIVGCDWYAEGEISLKQYQEVYEMERSVWGPYYADDKITRKELESIKADVKDFDLVEIKKEMRLSDDEYLRQKIDSLQARLNDG